MCLRKSKNNVWKAVKPHRTVLILEKQRLLHSLYTHALEEHNWRVVSCVTSPQELLQKYLTVPKKPDLLLLDYEEKHYPELLPVLQSILLESPFQYLLFVSSEERLVRDNTFLPPLLREVPVVLKFTHSIQDLVHDLDYLPDYGYPLMH